MVMIIGLVGPIGSGKGTVADILVRDRGFVKLVFSDVLREELKERGLEATRENLQSIGKELRDKYGLGAIAKVLIKKIVPGKDYVIEGFRSPGEVTEFRRLDEFFLVGVDATLENRFKRTKQRARSDDSQTLEEFKKREDRDLGKGETGGGQRILDTYAMRSKEILNNGTFDDLKKSVEKLLKEIKGEN